MNTKPGDTYLRFVVAVRMMREHQREYSRTRSHNALAAAKEYEALVDRMLKSDYPEKPKPTEQPKLF